MSTSNQTTYDYRNVLKGVLVERSTRNRNYSLRALARDMGINASRLSEIFHGKDGLSPTKAVDVAKRLAFSSSEADQFVTMVQAQAARSLVVRTAAKMKLETLQLNSEHMLLREDCVAALVGPHHFVLLELLRSPGTPTNAAWLSKKIGIDERETIAALDRLVRLGLIAKKQRRFKPTGQRFATTSDVPSQTIRGYHESILQGAIWALTEQSVDEREFGASFILIAEENLSAMKQELREARRRVIRKYEDIEKGTEVYCVATQAYRVTKKLAEKAKTKKG